MVEKLERVARVLHSQDPEMIYGADDFPSEASGYPTDRPAWTLYIDNAREVIEAVEAAS